VILEGRCVKGNPGILDGSHRLKLTDIWAPVGVDGEGSVSGRGSGDEQRYEQRGKLSHRFERQRSGKIIVTTRISHKNFPSDLNLVSS